LQIQKNQLTALPDSIGALSNLYLLNVSGNKITKLPESITRLTTLSILILENNNLSGLPGDFTKMLQLYDVQLSGNINLTITAEQKKFLEEIKLPRPTMMPLYERIF